MGATSDVRSSDDPFGLGLKNEWCRSFDHLFYADGAASEKDQIPITPTLLQKN